MHLPNHADVDDLPFLILACIQNTCINCWTRSKVRVRSEIEYLLWMLIAIIAHPSIFSFFFTSSFFQVNTHTHTHARTCRNWCDTAQQPFFQSWLAPSAWVRSSWKHAVTVFYSRLHDAHVRKCHLISAHHAQNPPRINQTHLPSASTAHQPILLLLLQLARPQQRGGSPFFFAINIRMMLKEVMYDTLQCNWQPRSYKWWTRKACYTCMENSSSSGSASFIADWLHTPIYIVPCGITYPKKVKI